MGGIIGAFVAILLLAYASRRAAFAGPPGQLRYGTIPRVLGVLLATMTLCLAYVMIFVEHAGHTVALALLTGAFGAGAIYMLAEVLRTRGKFDPAGIELETPWSGRKAQRFSDLVAARFDRAMNQYVLTFQDGTKIRLSNLLEGHGGVLEHVRALGKTVD